MNVPLAIPLPVITCSHNGSVSNRGWSGSEPIAVGYTMHLGTGQRVGACQLREPLVPAGREAECGAGEFDHRIARVAGPEVAVLVVAGGDRDVLLARPGNQLAGRRHADRRVETQLGVGALVQRRVDVGAGLGCQFAGEGGRRAVRDVLGHGRSLGERVGGHREVRRERQLLKADQARPLAGGDADSLGQRRPMLVRIGVPAVLDEPDPQRLALGRVRPARASRVGRAR